MKPLENDTLSERRQAFRDFGVLAPAKIGDVSTEKVSNYRPNPLTARPVTSYETWLYPVTFTTNDGQIVEAEFNEGRTVDPAG
ncbi:hypothetical protein K0651_10510 [Ornithinimicrobium sp. Arc0846-15]|nr:hypothetical protein [Ornithinimicrobium laminariae]